jgi:hypothetical protein
MIVPTDGRAGHSIWRAVVQGVYERQQRASYHVAFIWSSIEYLELDRK